MRKLSYAESFYVESNFVIITDTRRKSSLFRTVKTLIFFRAVPTCGPNSEIEKYMAEYEINNYYYYNSHSFMKQA